MYVCGAWAECVMQCVYSIVYVCSRLQCSFDDVQSNFMGTVYIYRESEREREREIERG